MLWRLEGTRQDEEDDEDEEKEEHVDEDDEDADHEDDDEEEVDEEEDDCFSRAFSASKRRQCSKTCWWDRCKSS